MNRQRRNDDVEIITGERPASLVKVTKRAACTRGYVPERLQDRFDAVVAVFDQACQERDIVAAYVKSGTRLAFDLPAPTVVYRHDCAVAADQRDLLHQSVDDFLDLLEIDIVAHCVH